MQVKLVCTDLVALARSRPDRRFRKITLSGVRECLLGSFLSLGGGSKAPASRFGAGHLIALKPSVRFESKAGVEASMERCPACN